MMDWIGNVIVRHLVGPSEFVPISLTPSCTPGGGSHVGENATKESFVRAM